MLNNTVISLVRTFVPIVVGMVVAWLQPFGIEVETEAAVTFLTGLAIAVYYALARLLEKKWPSAGWLLGAPKQPIYAEPPVPEQPID